MKTTFKTVALAFALGGARARGNSAGRRPAAACRHVDPQDGYIRIEFM